MALVEFATPSEVLNITEENNFFFFTFLDQRILNTMGMENIKRSVVMISPEINISYSFQLAIIYHPST